MKKIYRFAVMAIAMMAVSTVMISCGDDKEDTPTPSGEEKSVTNISFSCYVNDDSLMWDFENYTAGQVTDELTTNVKTSVGTILKGIGAKADEESKYTIENADTAAVAKKIRETISANMSKLTGASNKASGRYSLTVSIDNGSSFHAIYVFDSKITLSCSDYKAFTADGIKYQTLGANRAGVLPSFTKSKYDCDYTGDVEIPTSVSDGQKTYKVTALGKYAFYRSSVTSIKLNEGLTSIHVEAFGPNESLTAINIPSTVTKYISDKAADISTCFLGQCPKLTNVTLAEGLQSLPVGAFCSSSKYSDSSLISITIPSSIKKLPDYTFSGCKNLKDITMTNGTKELGSQVFNNTAIENIDFLPESITTIGQEDFNCCEKLTTATFKEGVKQVDKYVFGKCKALKEVWFPATLANMGIVVFGNCTALEAIHFKSSTPATLTKGSEYDTFSLMPETTKIYVPSANLDAYKSADVWKKYAGQIVGE